MKLEFSSLFGLILLSSFMLILGLYLLTNFGRLFKRSIKSEWLRKNIVVWLIAICLVLAISPTNHDFYDSATHKKFFRLLIIQGTAITIMTFLVFNITLLVRDNRFVRSLPFRKRMALILATIVVCTVLTSIPVNYIANGGYFKNLDLTILSNFYTGGMCGFIYITMSYVNLERQRKMSEKELEISRMKELKTKAELETLHSKINPHFLYNALNSIADLSVTDGKKARNMTIALADLFRYSINYNDHNYTTVNDEVAMTDVYLQIEKIRFEDQLNYSVNIEEGYGHYLVPRIILQPLVENAVKHGLRMTGQMTEIKLEVKKGDPGMIITIGDNGPDFPQVLTPGYGVKSVFDKLDLLFADNYEIFFHNHPKKEVSIRIFKLMKNEPVV